MDGDRAIKIYMKILDGTSFEPQTKEEIAYCEELKKQIAEIKRDNPDAIFMIPSV